VLFEKLILGWALADARRIEEETVRLLEQIRDEAADPAVRETVDALVQEEKSHIEHLGEIKEHPDAPTEDAERPSDALAHPSVVLPDGPTRDRLREVIDKEQATARFYALLAERCSFPAAKSVFRHIAEEEDAHTERLRALLGEGGEVISDQ
jgi:rubrerythrin